MNVFSDDLRAIHARMAEIVEKVGNGSLEPEYAKKGLQLLLEGKPFGEKQKLVVPSGLGFTMKPRDQINRLLEIAADQSWSGVSRSDIPSVPKKFRPRTPTERLLLARYAPPTEVLKSEHVTFIQWRDAFGVPEGYTKDVWRDMVVDEAHMRLVGPAATPGIRWVGFDPHDNWAPEEGRTLSSLWENPELAPRLAASESLMAQAYDPDWALKWDGTTDPHQDLAGWQYCYDGKEQFDNAPYLYRWVDDRKVSMRVDDAGYSSRIYATATVRDLF
jgi:hypothetical protein